MKTPRRDYKVPYAPQRQDIVDCTLESWKRCKDTRWKRKNRVAQLKRSLTRYKHGTNLPSYCHELHAYLLLQELKRPSENASVKKWGSYILELSAICEHIEEAIAWAHYEKRRKQEACHPENTESGQQTDLPPAGGQQTCVERNAENAKQETLLCADAAQLHTRKVN